MLDYILALSPSARSPTLQGVWVPRFNSSFRIRHASSRLYRSVDVNATTLAALLYMYLHGSTHSLSHSHWRCFAKRTTLAAAATDESQLFHPETASIFHATRCGAERSAGLLSSAGENN